jgi:hypothetical protein
MLQNFISSLLTETHVKPECLLLLTFSTLICDKGQRLPTYRELLALRIKNRLGSKFLSGKNTLADLPSLSSMEEKVLQLWWLVVNVLKCYFFVTDATNK